MSEINELVNVDINKVQEVVVIVNNDKPLFEKQDYQIVEGKPKYFELDEYGRSSGAIAMLSIDTIPLVKKKKITYPSPSGWKIYFENKRLFEKCHIIAYSLSAKLAKTNNIFIGTRNLNRSSMKKIENEIGEYIKDNLVKILYRVTIKYKGKDQIPIGILIEAQAINDDFGICRLCYNVQEGVKFQYSDGKIIKDSRIWSKILEKGSQITKIANRRKPKVNENYTIDTKTKKFHLLGKNCSKLDNVLPQNIQETIAQEKDLLDIGLKKCKECMKE